MQYIWATRCAYLLNLSCRCRQDPGYDGHHVRTLHRGLEAQDGRLHAQSVQRTARVQGQKDWSQDSSPADPNLTAYCASRTIFLPPLFNRSSNISALLRL